MRLNKKSVLQTGLVLGAGGVVFCTLASMVALCQGEDNSAKISTPLLMQAIDAASRVQAGNVVQVEALHEKGRAIVDVDILAANGQRYDVVIEASTGKVLSVTKDNEITKMHGRYVTKPISAW